METTAKRASDLKKIPGHKNYYRSEKSGIIYFKNAKLGKISTKETTIGKAKHFVEKRLMEHHTGASSGDVERKIMNVTNLPIADVWAEVYKNKEVESAPSTMKNYHKSWTYDIKPFWGFLNCLNVTNEKLQEYKAWYIKTYPDRDSEKAIIHFKLMIKHAQSRKFITNDLDLTILDSIKKVTSGNSRREKAGRVYTDGEISNMLLAAQSNSKPYVASRTYLMILLGHILGLRKSEGLTLTWDRVDFTTKRLKLWSFKNKKWRLVPFPEKIEKALLFQKQFTGSSNNVFPSVENPDRNISSQIFDKGWVDAKRKANIKGKARFHDLRHTCATRTSENNWSPLVACKMLDMSLKIYEKVYAKPSIDKITEYINRDYNNSNAI